MRKNSLLAICGKEMALGCGEGPIVPGLRQTDQAEMPLQTLAAVCGGPGNENGGPLSGVAGVKTRPRSGLPARKFRLGCWVAALLLAVGALQMNGELRPDPQKPSMYEVEAVYLYDFGKFVRWPASTGKGPIEICIAGNSEYEQAVGKIVAGEKIGGRPLSVLHIERPQDEKGCAILFIGSAVQGDLESFLSAASGKPILTVSDMPGFLDHGGMIEFLLIGDRVRFAIDLKPATQCNLSLSSELLKVAVKVTGGQAGGGGV